MSSIVVYKTEEIDDNPDLSNAIFVIFVIIKWVSIWGFNLCILIDTALNNPAEIKIVMYFLGFVLIQIL